MLHGDTIRVIIDPDNVLFTSAKMSFLQLTDEFADVFESDLPRYSGSAGPFYQHRPYTTAPTPRSTPPV